MKRDITIVLAVKAALLLVLWLLFFRSVPVSIPGDVAATVPGSDNDAAVPVKGSHGR